MSAGSKVAARLLVGWQATVGRFEQLENGTALASMRMLVGLALVIQMGEYCLSEAGRDVLVFSFADIAHGGYRAVKPTLLLSLFGGARPGTLIALSLCDMAFGLCLLLGIFGRLPAIFGWLVSASILGPSSPVSGGADLLLQAALFTLGLSDCTRTWSLDCRLRTGAWSSPELVPAWPRLLGLFQLGVMYGATGLQKLVSTTWLPADGYSALYQILQNPHWARWPSIIEDAHGVFVCPAAIATAITVPWELTFPAVLFFRRLRPAYALFGLMLHIGIGLTMEVGWFGLISLAFYPTLFPRWQGPKWPGPSWKPSPRSTPSPSG